MTTGRTLYLHIGLPKTASTYLQTVVFPGLTHLRYLGMPRSDRFSEPEDLEAGSRIMSCVVKRSAAIWREFGDEIFRDLLGDEAAWRASPRDLLISEEGIGRAGSRPHHLRAHLEEFRAKAAHWGFARLKVLCAFRRQDRWLGSHYAQISQTIPDASQRGFERNVDRMLNPYESRYKLGMLLDYSTLREQVAAVADELIMLPYELLVTDPDRFRRAVLDFLGAEGDPMTFADERRNVRSAGENRWTLRRRMATLRLRPYRLFRATGLPGSVSLPLPAFGRGKTIELTPDISRKVLSAYADSNRRLAQSLSLDLKGYGYY